MIIVKIWGGLGNQLFQYCFGRNISIKHNALLKFDNCISSYSKYHDIKSLAINCLIKKIDIVSQNEISEYKHFSKYSFLNRIERKLVQKIPSINKRYVVQDFCCPFQYYLNYGDHSYYDGYWQSENFFLPIKDVLKNEIVNDAKLDKVNSFYLNEIVDSNAVSIHIRRGDYISGKKNKRIFSVCTLPYYEKAISTVERIFDHPTFYVFSDDPEWAKHNFKGRNYRYIENNLLRPEIDLFLMSKCNHNIIANSTFSWWGAWLNSHQDKIVIAPKDWYVGRLNKFSAEIIPEDWIKL